MLTFAGRFIISVFVLAAVTFATRGLHVFGTPSEELGVFVVQPSTSVLRFERVGHACGGPYHSWVTSYTAYDGRPLSFSGRTYSSPSEASQNLQNLLQTATRVQEVGAEDRTPGEIAEARAVAFFAADEKELAAVIWTEGNSLLVVESESLDAALEFERTRTW